MITWEIFDNLLQEYKGGDVITSYIEPPHTSGIFQVLGLRASQEVTPKQLIMDHE